MTADDIPGRRARHPGADATDATGVADATRIAQLDGLRGIAILSVMIFHCGVPLFRGGFIGVDIFFVLSGYLISTLLVREFDRSQRIDFRAFYTRRVLRLAPALVVLLAAYCLASLLVLDADRARSNGIDSLIALFYLSNWARAFGLHPPDYLGHTWSLSIEEQFYLVWPVVLLFLLRATSRRNVLAATVGIALLSWALRIHLLAGGAAPDRLYNGSDTRADTLMIGCALGIAIASNLLAGSRLSAYRGWLSRVAPIACVALLAVCMTASWRSNAMLSCGLVAVEVLGAALIADLALNPASPVSRALRARWLVYLGSISYGLYLWHYPVYRAMFEMGCRRGTVIVLGSALAVAAAALSHHAVERPMLRLRKRLGADGAYRLAS